MKIETILTPAELPALAQRDLRATACVVFDVLRATSTFVTALHHGAKAIIPVSEIAEALAIKKAEASNVLISLVARLALRGVSARSASRPTKLGHYPESILLGGERNGVRISADGIDFDLGNSPREYTPEKVRGKTIVSTTTNGTRALRACVGAKIILASSFLNLGATTEFLRRNDFENILLICAGTRENKADEDILAAGALIELLGGNETIISDSARIARTFYTESKSNLAGVISNSENARRLLSIPDLRDDVAFCLQRDIFPLVTKMENGAIRQG
ncbi:MAG TPA: 2-phosphosulfolactate phosphatase [Verrucomicrobiae bacterium]|jgi:2-phosphosulfolactate phosphatase